MEQPYLTIEVNEPAEVEVPMLNPKEDPNLLPSKLITVFAESYTLYLKTQSAHWNCRSKNFYQLHLVYERIWDEIEVGIDRIAELLRALDVVVPASFPQMLSYSKIESIEGSVSMPNDFTMTAILLDDHKVLLQSLKEASDCGCDCPGAQNLLGDLSEKCLSHIYLLGSFLK